MFFVFTVPITADVVGLCLRVVGLSLLVAIVGCLLYALWKKIVAGYYKFIKLNAQIKVATIIILYATTCIGISYLILRARQQERIRYRRAVQTILTNRKTY